MGWIRDVYDDILHIFGQSPSAPVAGDQKPNPNAFIDSNLNLAALYPILQESMSISNDRSSRYADFDQMDRGDISAMLDAVADTATHWDRIHEDNNVSELSRQTSFKVVLGTRYGSSGPRKVMETTLKNTNLKEEIWEIARKMARDGDHYSELVIDPADNFIVDIAHPPVWQMVTRVDSHGRYLTGSDKEGKPLPFQQLRADGKAVAGWQPFEMVQWKLYPSKGRPYSERSVLDYMRRDWMLRQQGEEAISMMRKVRSTPRRHLYVDTTGKGRVESEQMLRDRANAFFRSVIGPTAGGKDRGKLPAIESDIFWPNRYYTMEGVDRALPSLDKIEMEDPNIMGLAETGDIEYFNKKLQAKIPGELTGNYANTRRDLTLQDIQFGRFIVRVQQRLTAGIRQILDTALLLQGYRNVDYTIVWPQVTVATDWKHSDGFFRMSMGAANAVDMGMVTPWFAAMRLYNLSEDEAKDQTEQAYQWKLDHPAPTGVDANNDGGVDEPGTKGAGSSAPFAPSAGASDKDATTKLQQIRKGSASA